KDEPSSADFGGGALPAAEPGPSTGSLPRLRTPLAASGIAPEVLRVLTPWAEQNGLVLTPGGMASKATGSAGAPPARLAPGDAVAVDLLRGDASLSAIGTITAVDGDRVLAFGHPFFLTGPTRLPMSTAEIVAVIPNLESSFKIGASGTPLG